MEDDLPPKNGRRPQKNGRRPQKKWKTTSQKKREDDDFKKIRFKSKTTSKKNFSQFLLNLGANLSWGWLSSLRFLQ
jgi:hypothetical protein